MNKLSKRSLIVVKKMLKDFADKEGITPLTVQTIIHSVKTNDFAKMTEQESSILADSMANEEILIAHPELLDLYEKVDNLWAKRAKENGTKIPASHHRVLH